MIITNTALNALRKSFNNDFNRGMESAPHTMDAVARTIPVNTGTGVYGFLAGMPGVREFVGPRLIKNLKEYAFTIQDKKWESTIAVQRTDIVDDNLGLYPDNFAQLGMEAMEHREGLVWNLMKTGFDATYGVAWDGQFMFDTDHLTWDENGNETTFSNTGGGAGNAWFLTDSSKPAMKPIIFQNRENIRFTAKDKENDTNVFENDEYQYGTYARYNAGYGMFQCAFGSKDTLSTTTVNAARVAMNAQRKPSGAKLSLKLDTIICGMSNTEAALEIAKAQRNASGATNVWAGRFNVIEVPYLD